MAEQPASEAGHSAVDAYVVDLENFHHIQRTILARLYNVASLPYAELKPTELTGNAFNYHLRHVIAQKLLVQTADGHYQLSAYGRLLVDAVSLPSMKLKLRPVVGLTLLVVSPRHGTLLYRSNREPMRNYISLPFGKLRLGEDLPTTFTRMLAKRNLSSDDISETRPLGSANIRYYAGETLISHHTSMVWRVMYLGPATSVSTPNGHSLWQKDPEPASDMLTEIHRIADWPSQELHLEISVSLPR